MMLRNNDSTYVTPCMLYVPTEDGAPTVQCLTEQQTLEEQLTLHAFFWVNARRLNFLCHINI